MDIVCIYLFVVAPTTDAIKAYCIIDVDFKAQMLWVATKSIV